MIGLLARARNRAETDFYLGGRRLGPLVSAIGASGTVVHDIASRRRSERRTLVASRVTVVLLTVAAALAALVGSKEIFSRALFGWAAMGAAFGPLLIVRTVLRRVLAPPRVFFAMLAGFFLSVLSHTFSTDVFPAAAAWKGFGNYVVPWAVALVIALYGTRTSADTAGLAE